MVGKLLAAHHHRMSGAQLLGLQSELDVANAREFFLDQIGLVSHHSDQALDAGSTQRIDYVADQGATVGFTQHFR